MPRMPSTTVQAAAVVVLLLSACATSPPATAPAHLVPPDAPALGALQPGETALFNGHDLTGWRESEEFNYDDVSRVFVKKGCILIQAGSPQAGITWDREFRRSNYELRLDAARLDGSDFFCGMTFPVGDDYCTLIVGGWGGMVVGLSNVDGMSAVENLTTLGKQFDDHRWYRIRLRVSDETIQVWIDGEEVIALGRQGHAFDIWWEQHPARPFGINTWYTAAALRGIRLRRIE